MPAQPFSQQTVQICGSTLTHRWPSIYSQMSIAPAQLSPACFQAVDLPCRLRHPCKCRCFAFAVVNVRKRTRTNATANGMGVHRLKKDCARIGHTEVRFSSAGTLAFEYEKQRSALSCVQNRNERPNPTRIEKVMAKRKSKNFQKKSLGNKFRPSIITRARGRTAVPL